MRLYALKYYRIYVYKKHLKKKKEEEERQAAMSNPEAANGRAAAETEAAMLPVPVTQ